MPLWVPFGQLRSRLRRSREQTIKECLMKPVYKEKYPHLFEPMYVGRNKVRFNNRVRVAPIGTGATGGGGEVGHIPTAFHTDWQCSCGKHGCLELTASATGIIRAAREYSPFKEMEKVTAKDVYDAAAAGDENAKRVTEEAGTALGVAAAILGCVVNPEVILLGGGVSAAGRALLDPVEDAFQKNVFPPCRDVRFALAQLGNNAGIFGGAALFFTQST